LDVVSLGPGYESVDNAIFVWIEMDSMSDNSDELFDSSDTESGDGGSDARWMDDQSGLLVAEIVLSSCSAAE
jgi:hypothetical protein